MTTALATVVGVDGSSASLDAVRWACHDAELHNSDLVLVSSLAVPADVTGMAILPPSYFDNLQADAARSLADATTAAKQYAASPSLLTMITEMSEQPPIPMLLDRSKNARLVVVGSRGLGAISRGVLGSVSSALSTHAHCPVAILRSLPPDGAPLPVVVGTDGSLASIQAMETAFDEAFLRHAPLTAVHAWSDRDLSIGVAGFGEVWPRGRLQAEALLTRALESCVEKYPSVPVRRVVVKDRPVQALMDHAQSSQLVVVGSHGRGGFGGMLLGSTGRSLAHELLCPLMITRAHL